MVHLPLKSSSLMSSKAPSLTAVPAKALSCQLKSQCVRQKKACGQKLVRVGQGMAGGERGRGMSGGHYYSRSRGLDLRRHGDELEMR